MSKSSPPGFSNDLEAIMIEVRLATFSVLFLRYWALEHRPLCHLWLNQNQQQTLILRFSC